MIQRTDNSQPPAAQSRRRKIFHTPATVAAASVARRCRLHRAFSLIEMLIAVTVIGVLTAIVMGGVSEIRYKAREAQSLSNIRQLATANLAHSADYGRFVRDTNDANNTRWFGSRTGSGYTGGAADVYSGEGGYLSDYLEGGKVRYCPVFLDMADYDSKLVSNSQFEQGTGGYGYNWYLGWDTVQLFTPPPTTGGSGGKRPKDLEQSTPGALITNVPDAPRTVMFTSTAIVYGTGLAETAQSAQPQIVTVTGLGASMTPTTHFRFRGRALVAWADGHVTFELPNNSDTSWSVYGGNNSKYRVGWFGPADNNGYWNPRYSEGEPY